MQNPFYSSKCYTLIRETRGASIFPGLLPSKAIGLAVLALLLVGCDLSNDTLRIHTTDYTQFDPQALQSIFEEQAELTITDATVDKDLSPLDSLISGEADLALVENSTAFVPGIRAVLPVFESYLHLLMADDFGVSDSSNTLLGASFFIPNHSSAGQRFVELVTKRQGLKPGDYTLTSSFEEGVTDIIVYFGPINPDNTDWTRPGYSLLSLDNELNPQRAFYEEGIAYTAPHMRPKIIPALTYDLPGNEGPLLTVAVDTLLAARKDLSEVLIYKLTRTLLEQKPRFSAIAPHLFSGISESFNRLDLNFPLHDGARRYLDRDEPSLLERYAETINLLIYMLFLIVSTFVAFSRWRAHRKKDRIDTFYERVMSARAGMDTAPAESLLKELDDLEREAFESLINEKLAANESFKIFIDQLQRLRNDLKEKTSS
ncbi:MAG: TAXI family TRAP transporter solute-binding subunit [Pseudomonadales bacterium]